MTPTPDPLQSHLINLAGEIAEMFSFNRSVGQIYGLLYSSAHAISLEEIAKICQMSKGNASIHLRTLETWGAVHRSWKPGIRRDYYKVNSDLQGVLMKRFQEAMSKRLLILRKHLDQIKNDSSFAEYSKQSQNGHMNE